MIFVGMKRCSENGSFHWQEKTCVMSNWTNITNNNVKVDTMLIMTTWIIAHGDISNCIQICEYIKTLNDTTLFDEIFSTDSVQHGLKSVGEIGDQF